MSINKKSKRRQKKRAEIRKSQVIKDKGSSEIENEEDLQDDDISEDEEINTGVKEEIVEKTEKSDQKKSSGPEECKPPCQDNKAKDEKKPLEKQEEKKIEVHKESKPLDKELKPPVEEKSEDKKGSKQEESSPCEKVIPLEQKKLEEKVQATSPSSIDKDIKISEETNRKDDKESMSAQCASELLVNEKNPQIKEDKFEKGKIASESKPVKEESSEPKTKEEKKEDTAKILSQETVSMMERITPQEEKINSHIKNVFSEVEIPKAFGWIEFFAGIIVGLAMLALGFHFYIKYSEKVESRLKDVDARITKIEDAKLQDSYTNLKNMVISNQKSMSDNSQKIKNLETEGTPNSEQLKKSFIPDVEEAVSKKVEPLRSRILALEEFVETIKDKDLEKSIRTLQFGLEEVKTTLSRLSAQEPIVVSLNNTVKKLEESLASLSRELSVSIDKYEKDFNNLKESVISKEKDLSNTIKRIEEYERRFMKLETSFTSNEALVGRIDSLESNLAAKANQQSISEIKDILNTKATVVAGAFIDFGRVKLKYSNEEVSTRLSFTKTFSETPIVFVSYDMDPEEVSVTVQETNPTDYKVTIKGKKNGASGDVTLSWIAIGR